MRKQIAIICGLAVIATLSITSACNGAETANSTLAGTAAINNTTTATVATPAVTTTTTTVSSTLPLASSASASPTPATTTTPHEALDIQMSQLVADYAADPVASAARYEGRRLIVRNVKLTEVSELYKPVSTDMFVSSQGFKFRTDYLDYVTAMEVGYVVDIEGVLEGPSWGFIVLQHCSYTIIDASQGIPRPDYQTSFG